MLLVTNEGNSCTTALHYKSTVTIGSVKINTKHVRIEGRSSGLQVFIGEFKVWPDDRAKEKMKWSPKSIEFIIWGTHFMAIDPIVEVCPSGVVDRQMDLYINIHRASALAWVNKATDWVIIVQFGALVLHIYSFMMWTSGQQKPARDP